jgi:tRNA A-37 threonylcarbamoyl transferase component Bud32
VANVAVFRDAGFSVETLAVAEGPVRLHVMPDPSATLARGEPIKRNNYRAASRVDVAGLGPVLLKVHRPRGLIDVVRAALRTSRARSEWIAARYLVGAGIPTPEPLLLAERRFGPLLEQAASGARFLSRRETFVPALAAQPRDKARALVVRASRLVRAMHDRGISHGDLHSGNVLVGPGPGDRCELHVIDLHTVRVGRRVSRRARDAQLAQWLHSLSAVVGPGGRLRALLAYLGERPARRALARSYRRLASRIVARERRRVRSRSRRCVEEGQGFTSSVAQGTGWRRRDTAPEAIERAILDHDRVLAANGPGVLKVGRKSRVTRAGGFVVKERLEGSLARRLEGMLFPWRRRSGYRNAQGLVVRAVGTAAPVACVSRAGRHFTLYDDCTAFPRLDHRVRDALARGEWSRERTREMIEATAVFAARMHRLGIWHGDLKACNWLVEERGSRIAFHLVDTDRVRFLRAVDRDRRLRNLAQLSASIPRSITRADRLRWWRRYAVGTELAGRAQERAAARDVAVLLSKKTVVVDDPIE